MHSAVFGAPIRRIPLERMKRAFADDDLRPIQWGGWGFRWMPGRTAVVRRRGPALVVETTRGTWFAITLDDPEAPAAVLAASGVPTGHVTV